jgi:7 transmembrane helices usually fused to an inactive transglutaminase/Transglutaminase-like superfamily
MARGWWSWAAALICAGSAVGISVARHVVLGPDLDRPRGAGVWKITWAVTGTLTDKDAVIQPLPPNFRRQHVYDERYHSKELLHRAGRERNIDRHDREIVWRRANASKGPEPFRLTYVFRCVLGMHRPTNGMDQRTRELDAAPGDGVCRRPGPHIESDDKSVAEAARALSPENGTEFDQVQAFYEYVAGLDAQPMLENPSAADCLREQAGDALGKSRLVVALCRSRGIAARLVWGLNLAGDREPALHHWAEAWLPRQALWVPMDPTYRYFGAAHFPPHYVVLHLGDDDPVRGAAGAKSAFLAQPLADPASREDEEGGEAPAPFARALFLRLSLYNLRPAEQHLVKFLLLLPLSALIVSLYRTVIGVPTFGTFSPALLGLAFLDLKALPWGLGIFVATVLVGWILRRVLDHFHLLLVPRTAILLTLIVIFLMGVVGVAHHFGAPVTHYIALFPLVILTHLVERFWTVEAEDGTVASFKTLLGTLVVAVTVSVVLSREPVAAWMMQHPESLGLVLAAQFVLGRYTGYRVTELYRFQDLIEEEKA